VLVRREVLAVKRARIALVAFFVVIAVVHALVASWTPVQADDWLHWIWSGRHDGDSSRAVVGAFVTTHFEFSDMISFVLARCREFHVLVSPAVGVLLVIGIFVVAMRRLPTATWRDLLGVALASALIWIAQPHAGVTWFYTQSVALHVYGVAAALWFVAPFRCGWNVRRWMWPVLALVGYCVGTSTPAIATATLVGVVIAIRNLPRARWMWFALGGLAIGTVINYVRPPWIEFGRVFRRGFEPNLILMKLPIEMVGRVISLIAALVLVDLCLAAAGRARASLDGCPDPKDGARWLAGWFVTSVWCLFGPHHYEATFLPATCMIVIAALPYLMWLASSKPIRYVIVGFAIGVHVVVWATVLTTYHKVGKEADVRMAILQHEAKSDRIPQLEPYSQVLPSSWFFGEDLALTRLRQLVALDVFKIPDIRLESFRRLELNPGIKLELEIDGPSAAELQAAAVPRWSTVISVAREQFERLVKRLRTITSQPITARLVVKNVNFPERGERPLLVAWSERGDVVSPRTAISPIDENNEYTMKLYGDDVKLFNEAWIVHDGTSTKTPYRNGSPRARPMTAQRNVVVLCNAERCLAADAFIPRF
jgi:hypothetical protein